MILLHFLPQSSGDLVLARGLGEKWGSRWLRIEQRVHMENGCRASQSCQFESWRASPRFLCLKVKPPKHISTHEVCINKSRREPALLDANF